MILMELARVLKSLLSATDAVFFMGTVNTATLVLDITYRMHQGLQWKPQTYGLFNVPFFTTRLLFVNPNYSYEIYALVNQNHGNQLTLYPIQEM